VSSAGDLGALLVSGVKADALGERLLTKSYSAADSHEYAELVDAAGAPLAVLRAKSQSDCGIGGNRHDAPSVLSVSSTDGGAVALWTGWVDGAGVLEHSGKVVMANPLLPTWFTLDGAWGFSEGFRVRVALDPWQGDVMTDIHVAEGFVWQARARKDTVYFADAFKLFAWQKGAGKTFLGPTTGEAHAIALSDARVVWLEVTGGAAGTFDTAEIFAAPFTSDPLAFAPTPLADVASYLMGTTYLSTSDTHAALSNVELLVVELETGAITSLAPKAGTWLKVAAVTESHVYAQEIKQGEEAYFRRWLRFEIAKLPELAAMGFE